MTVLEAPIVLDDGQADDFRRDRYGRPLVTPASGGKPVPYTRASSAAKVVDDTYNLELWARRNVAFGMAHDASLVARLLAVGGTPHTWTNDQRKAVRDIVTAAEQIAQAHKGADIGTAVHALTEQVDRGETVHAGPYQADIDAYLRAIHEAGFEVVADWIEVRIVNDDLAMAGTADRLLRHIATGRIHIADIKTGRSVDYGGLSWAAQLAAYAGGELYDPTTDQRLPTPDIDRERGVIIHLPAGEGRCDLHWIDLAAGYEAAVEANRVRDMRKAAKGWMRPLEIPTAAMVEVLAASLEAHSSAATVEVDPERIAAEAVKLRARWQAAIAAGAPAPALWPTGVPLFKQGGPTTWQQLLAVEEAVDKAEGHVGIPFADTNLPKDPTAPVEPPRALGLVPPIVDGGERRTPPSTRPAVDDLKALHDALPTDLQLAAHGLAHAAGIPSNHGQRSDEDWAALANIVEAAVAEHGKRKARLASMVSDLDDEDFVLALVQTATDTPTQAKNLEATLESLTADEAERFEHLADAYGSGPDAPVTLKVDDEGVLRVVPGGGAEAAVLATYGGSKAEALAAAKEIAALHGRPKPRSVAQAVQDPVVVALLIAAS